METTRPISMHISKNKAKQPIYKNHVRGTLQMGLDDAETLKSNLGISPSISWSRTGQFQLNQKITITLEKSLDLSGGFASFFISVT